jgi:hypothetical protein
MLLTAIESFRAAAVTIRTKQICSIPRLRLACGSAVWDSAADCLGRPRRQPWKTAEKAVGDGLPSGSSQLRGVINPGLLRVRWRAVFIVVQVSLRALRALQPRLLSSLRLLVKPAGHYRSCSDRNPATARLRAMLPAPFRLRPARAQPGSPGIDQDRLARDSGSVGGEE